MNADAIGTVLTLGIFAGILSGCGGGSSMLPHESKASSASFQSYEQVMGAYSSVIPGQTRTPDLSAIGFDSAVTPNVEILTDTGIAERFLVQSASSNKHIPPAVQECLDLHEHCSALVFRLGQSQSRHVGNAVLDITGFQKNVVVTGWSAEVMLIIRDGTVVYKLMSGQPHTETARDTVQPLGPIQNISNQFAPPAKDDGRKEKRPGQ